MKEEYEFDFDEILDEFRSGKKLTGKGGLLAPLIKQLTESALEAEVESHIEEIYQVSISTATISLVTDKIISKVKEWQARLLEAMYPFVWLDAIHYKIKEDGRYISKAVYTILGVNLEGKKEVLGLYISENEGANFWLQVLTDLQNRGVEDILIASG